MQIDWDLRCSHKAYTYLIYMYPLSFCGSLKAPYSSKIDIILHKKGLTNYGINTIIK